MDVLSSCWRGYAGGKPFEPFGKDSICSEGGSTGRRTDWPCHINIADRVKLLRPSVQLPAGIHGCAVYKDFGRDGKGKDKGKDKGNGKPKAREWQGNGMVKRPGRQRPPKGREPSGRLDITVPCSVFRPNSRDFRNVQGRR